MTILHVFVLSSTTLDLHQKQNSLSFEIKKTDSLF